MRCWSFFYKELFLGPCSFHSPKTLLPIGFQSVEGTRTASQLQPVVCLLVLCWSPSKGKTSYSTLLWRLTLPVGTTPSLHFFPDHSLQVPNHSATETTGSVGFGSSSVENHHGTRHRSPGETDPTEPTEPATFLVSSSTPGPQRGGCRGGLQAHPLRQGGPPESAGPDGRGTTGEAAKRASGLFGAPLHELRGPSVSSLWHPQDPPDIMVDLGPPALARVETQDPDGSL